MLDRSDLFLVSSPSMGEKKAACFGAGDQFSDVIHSLQFICIF